VPDAEVATVPAPRGWEAAMQLAANRLAMRVRACPHCGLRFVKVGKQQYCSKPCAARAGFRRFADRREKRDYAAEHAQRQTAKQRRRAAGQFTAWELSNPPNEADAEIATRMAAANPLAPILEQPIGVLGLSARPRHVLTWAGQHTVGDVARLTLRELRRMKNMGRVSIAEIYAALDKCGVAHA
jgi:DNA-directed RNA polymerase alpha subunit